MAATKNENRTKNSYDKEYIITNNDIGKLSSQKIKVVTAGIPKQIPFSLGVGVSNRSRGIPYFCSLSDKPEVYFPTPIQSKNGSGVTIYD